MTKTIRLEIGGAIFVAQLNELEAPQTCNAFTEKLPIKGTVIHARWSGEAVWFPMGNVGINVPFENHTSHPSRGDLLYYPGGISEKELLMSYGSAIFSSKVGQLQGNHFATIIKGVEKLPEIGRRVLWEGAKPITVSQG